MLRRGYLHWAHVDKRRPVLVISINARNERANAVLVVPCSTNLHNAPTHVRLKRGEGGAPESCVLKCEQIMTLSRDAIDPDPLGTQLEPDRMMQVERGVLRAIGVPA